MNTDSHAILRRGILDTRRCSDPATVLQLIGHKVKRQIVKLDDLSTLSESETKDALAFLDRWFPDRTVRLIDRICTTAAGLVPVR